MRRASTIALAIIALAALLAPWLPLRNPDAQPDGLVVRDLPPFATAFVLRQADGTRIYAHEVRPLPDGGAAYRRGETWRELPVEALDGPGPEAWLGRERFLAGTDGLGRDLFSRLLHGARVSLLVGLVAATMALAVGTAIGLTAGLAGGFTDAILMRFTDLALAIPRVFLALLLVALWRPALATTVLVVGATTWMAAARMVRGEVLSVRERDWVAAARASGARPLRVALGHLFPAVLAPVLVEAAMRVGDAILLEAALSFLGLGVPPPTASWGNLISDGRASLLSAWWVATLPGIAIAVTVLGLHGLGDGLAERVRRTGAVARPVVDRRPNDRPVADGRALAGVR